MLNWLIAHHPELLERVKALVARDQVEILTGGYYEPILATLPDVDKLGQIHKLTDAVGEQFGAAPQGLWLAERIWEPYLAKPLAAAGVQYVIVDDTHFEGAGFDKDKDMFGYFITEEQGYPLAVFPALTHLRYTIPWGTVQENIEWLYRHSHNNLVNLQPRLALMADDGEKFGVWPGTYEHCWENGYMDDLFAAIQTNQDWLHTTTPAAFIEQYTALGRVYLPTASYTEMGEWALPPARAYQLANLRQGLQDDGNQDVLRFVRGGIWRNFMVKYDEINHMHKRALRVSALVHAMPDGPEKDKALDSLWSAQSNDAYWHGLFGGIYLFHVRIANYANLIAAETLADGGHVPLTVRKFDLDIDGNDEIVLSGDPFCLMWDLARGGALREWDYRPARYNLLNVMTRRHEGYHQDLIAAVAERRVVLVGSEEANQQALGSQVVRVKEPGMENYLIGDWYRRGAFIDHFLREDATLEDFYRAAYPEQGDCVILPYEVDWSVDGGAAMVELKRNAHIWVGEDHLPVQVIKRFTVQQGMNQLRVAYSVRNQADRAITTRFAVETAVAYDGGDNETHCAFLLGDAASSLAAMVEHEDVTSYAATTTLRKLRTETTLSQAAHLWRFPLETVTLSEAGFERGYQGTVFLQWWPLHLTPGEVWNMEMKLTITEL